QENATGAAPKSDEWWSSPPPSAATPHAPAIEHRPEPSMFAPAPAGSWNSSGSELPNESVTGGSYFCGDTRFFSLNWALQTIARCKLTGALRLFWEKEPVDLLVRRGEVVLVTTRDPELYCSEAPITLVNVDPEKIAEARARQRESGQPLFTTLAEGEHILHEPAAQ